MAWALLPLKHAHVSLGTSLGRPDPLPSRGGENEALTFELSTASSQPHESLFVKDQLSVTGS